MFDAKSYFYNLLKNDSALVAALGSTDKIMYMYPNSFDVLPVVTYQCLNDINKDFFDNVCFSDNVSFQVDVWANTSTTAICKLIDAILAPLLFTRDYAGDVPEPDAKIFHKVLRYSRLFTADDLDLV